MSKNLSLIITAHFSSSYIDKKQCLAGKTPTYSTNKLHQRELPIFNHFHLQK